MIWNPLEPFRIEIFSALKPYPCYILTNANIMYFIILLFFVYLFIYNTKNEKTESVPTSFQYLLENFYFFVLQVFRQQVNNIMALKYFPVALLSFICVLIANMLGLFPYCFTVTSQLLVTFFYAFTIFIGITIIGFVNNQIKFLKFFVPSGVPVALLPFLVVIETASYIIRPFSLGVRLFANMLAGHTLLKIISIFVYNVFKKCNIGIIIPSLFVFFIVFLEFSIAIVQGYIFFVLVSIYINDMYNIGSH